ncbi:PIN-like domain-containing protein [Janthinobacterium tructae]|uniref:PIN-like domain-containing protein n=1 Tax=Janthinobacterium tructae TaxID=2590869 RepID=UPI00249B1DF6|nr:PIN-like domain-containing protein [Janthinobacterium tructae]MDI3292535.1 PIN-like domain-containing protein [Janthinobacterium tructae]
MKDMFPEYDVSRAINYENVWKDALFVFDTNVLLNLYRYQVNTRDELLAVLDSISDQIWIPYQVGLEFQKNRQSVIAEQSKRFSEVKRTIEKAKTGLSNELGKLKLQERHSLINPEPLISSIGDLTSKFLDELDHLEKSQQTITGEDPLKIKLEALFDGRMGLGFTKQEQLDALHKLGEQRYKFRIPPGFEDDSKDSKEPDEFMHAGLIYKRKYGDFILWTQILDYCRENEKKSLIFITDDAKEDWWRIIDLEGPKTIGPRAELINEALRIGKIENFLMYSPHNFLKNANSTLKAKVSDDAIQEVKDISSIKKLKNQQQVEIISMAYDELEKWLLNNSMIIIGSRDKMTLTAFAENKHHTYVLATAFPSTNHVSLYDRTSAIVTSSIFGSPDGEVPENITVVWIAINKNHAREIRDNLLDKDNFQRQRPLGTNIIISTINDPEKNISGFFPQWEFAL